MSVCNGKRDNHAARHCLSERERATYRARQLARLVRAEAKPADLLADVFLNRLKTPSDAVRASEALLSADESKRARQIASARAHNRFVVARVGNVPGDRCGWRLRDSACFPGLVGAVAIQRPVPRDHAL